MKILLLSFWFSEYCVKLANALAPAGSVKLMLPHGVAGDSIAHLSSDVDLELFKKVDRRNPVNLLYSAGMVKSISHFQPDIVHMQCNGHAWFSFLLPIAGLQYCMVFTVHDPVPHPGEGSPIRSFSNRVVRWIGKHFIVHASTLKSQMIAEYGMDGDSIHVIPIGSCNFDESKSPDGSEPGNSILFFGRIQDYKGIEILVAAEPLIAETIPNFQVVIAGTGKRLEPYLSAVHDRKRFVIINRHITDEEIPQLFKSAAIVVLPYTQASQSGVIPLAYSYRKPVIATRVGGLPEVVDHGKTGILIPPNDAGKLARAVGKLLADREAAQQMGKNGHQKLKAELSWETIAEKTMQVYQQCLKAQPS